MMHSLTAQNITDVIGAIPYRMAFAGGWIDQPFISQQNPNPPGSMVVVGLEPTCWFMERAGMATGTRKVAMQLWNGRLPEGERMGLVKQLYAEENRGKQEPSGSQDMIGLIYPGVNRLDFDYAHEGGLFPRHIESNNDPDIADWLERVIKVVPVAPRPPGYNPLGKKNLDPVWIHRLGETGKDCYDAILAKDIHALGSSLNHCMECWEALLPHTVRHEMIGVDLPGILRHYQSQYTGAMYSGCGGGYLYVVSEEPIPEGFSVRVRCRGRVG
ncbi:MAG: hypothetical protein MI725_04335 [Pirellulales bacterium]|nr:hypothetical protein [Pirellulales bacterium]